MSTQRETLRAAVPALPLEIQLRPEQVDAIAPPDRGERVRLRPAARDGRDGVRTLEVLVDGWLFEVRVEPARRAELRERAARAAAEHEPHARLVLRAQIPGRVVRVWATAGQQVEQGERLLAIEAMKMENEVRAPRAGVIAAIHVELGGRVERDEELLTLS
jgi:glutaconyl-CoA/methylmalonyl-CoA decarboxylase subunit gamma